MTRPAGHIILNDFEKLYIQLKEKEGRVYTDEQVASLPDVAEIHPHYKEWQARKESFQKLVTYLKKRNHLKDFLEIGCGNGWLSRQLASLPGSRVIGTDINFTEIQQGATVFKDIPNLHFIYGHPLQGMFEETKFDVIVFAASLQYFSPLRETIKNSLQLLRPHGEIHIIDTHFYPLSGLSAAKKRSLLYFEAVGFPEMASWYFHHTLEDIDTFHYSVLYDPDSLFTRFMKNKNPFHWIRIQH
ncbi:MAG: class I SAM-dependent methyltransferase [Bacteroidota bacterium]|nr:class I SAM-dependent methyltransferase [Bacteroidota bacterium]